MEYERLWGVLIELRVIDCQSLDSERWLISTGIPLVKQELLEQVPRGEALPWTWLGCWLGASVTVLTALRDAVLGLWKELAPEAAAELFHHFHAHPRGTFCHGGVLSPSGPAEWFFLRMSDSRPLGFW